MMMNEYDVLDRFKNLLTVKNQLYLETITDIYNEHDLKTIIWLLGDYIAIKEARDER